MSDAEEILGNGGLDDVDVWLAVGVCQEDGDSLWGRRVEVVENIRWVRICVDLVEGWLVGLESHSQEDATLKSVELSEVLWESHVGPGALLVFEVDEPLQEAGLEQKGVPVPPGGAVDL